MAKHSRYTSGFIGGAIGGALLLGAAFQGYAMDIGRGENYSVAQGPYGDTASASSPSVTFTAFSQAIDYSQFKLDNIVSGMSFPCLDGSDATKCTATGPYRYFQASKGQAADRLPSGTARRDDGIAIVTARDVTTAFDSNDPRSGFGTRSFSAGYKILREERLLPQVRAAVQLNFLTLDQYKGIGQGEYDAAFTLNLDKWFGKWNLFAEGSYVLLGESDLSDTLKYVNYSAGIGYQIRDNLYLALVGNGAAAQIDGFQEPIEGGVRANWMFMDKTGLESYAAKGLTAGASEYTASLTVFRLF
ncbi:MAG: hypothetical protein CXR30_10240 [Geobacter sp.]|nr:MAG: hypothetical protein CXR30_10240 [Geobacter sp.]